MRGLFELNVVRLRTAAPVAELLRAGVLRAATRAGPHQLDVTDGLPGHRKRPPRGRHSIVTWCGPFRHQEKGPDTRAWSAGRVDLRLAIPRRVLLYPGLVRTMRQVRLAPQQSM